MTEIKKIDSNALMQIWANKSNLTFQEYSTLRGQVLAGDGAAALKGLKTIKNRRQSAK